MTLIQRRLNVDATSWRCIDVEPTMYKRYVTAGSVCVILYEDPIQLHRNPAAAGQVDYKYE